MPNSFPVPVAPEEQGVNKTRRLAALAVAVVFGLVAFFLWWVSTKPTSQPVSETQPTLGPEERAYTGSVGVDHVTISRAENFLHQEVTTIAGQITNGGNRSLASVELTIEFYDDLNQIAQREVRTLFGPPGPPISPGDNREFEVSFDHISTSWNMRQPVIQVTAVQFAPLK
jgi:hypothetical protein